MRAAVVAEYRKLASTRLWWVLLIALAGYLAFVGGVLAFGAIVRSPAPASGTDAPSTARTESSHRNSPSITGMRQ